MANLNLSEFTEKLFVADADHTFIWDSAASISKRVSRNSWLNSGTLTSDAPVTISQTWNAGSNVMTALKVVATDQASNAGSNMLELWSGNAATLKVRIDKGGNIWVPNAATIGNSATALALGGGNFYPAGTSGSISTLGTASVPFFGIWVGTSSNAAFLTSDSLNTLALRNGTAAQTFNVYGTYTSITDYRRLTISCDNTTGLATIATNKGSGTTTGDTDLKLQALSSSYLQVRSTGRMFNVSGSVNIYYPTGNSFIISSRDAIGGSVNTGMGFQVFEVLSAGTQNAALGLGALGGAGTANNNVGLGAQSGRFITGGSTPNAVTENSIYLGALTKAAASGETNQIVIGYDATGIGSNSVVLGNDSITKTALKGNVGIGTTAPSEKLHVLGGKVLFGDPSDPTGTAGNGELTLHARTLPQLNMVSNVGTNAFFGLSLKAGAAERAGLLVNMQSGEVKMGALSGSGYFPTFWSNGVEIMRFSTAGNVGIGTTSPTSKLHVEAASPAVLIKNTSASGYSELLFSNTVVSNNGFWLNGSTTAGYGGASSLNIQATIGPIAFHTASVTNALSIAQNGAITCIQSITSQSSISANTNAYIMWGGGTSSRMLAPSDGIIQFTDAATTGFNRLQFGGTTNLFPAIKRSAVRIQAVLANDTGFTNIQGKLTTDTDYTATVVTPTGFLTLYDAQGIAYRVPCVAAP